MGSRLKEEEKIEKSIRALSKQVANKRCINCNSLGPQYVCLNFWTFVCTTCSGIHREFTHRVKSVSMSKFTCSEVAALQNGGNERAKEIYFKEWDCQRQSLPDSSNVERLRSFIKSVYVDRRFSGERQLSRFKGGDQDIVNEIRRSVTKVDYHGDSKSPYEERYDDHRAGGRQSNATFEDRLSRFDDSRSPARFETERSRYNKGYNDHEEKGRFDNRERRHENQRSGGLDRWSEERSTRRLENVQHHRESSGDSPPPIRSVKEILGDDIPALRVEHHVTATSNGSGNQRGHKLHHSQDSHFQRFGSSSSFGSLDGNGPVLKRANSGSLIDFSPEPETPVIVKQPDKLIPSLTAQQETNPPSSIGWAMFDAFITTSAPSGVTSIVNSSTVQMSSSRPLNEHWASLEAAPHSQSYGASPSGFIADSWSAFDGTTPKSSISLGSSNQAWNAFPSTTVSNSVQPLASMPLPPIQSQELPGVAISITGPPSANNSSKLREEIPKDFFISAVPGDNLHVGLQMVSDNSILGCSSIREVLPSLQMNGSLQPQKSMNPFDIPDGRSSMLTGNVFPSLNSLQTALPNLNMGPVHISGHTPQWMQSTGFMVVPSVAPVGGLPVSQEKQLTMPSSLHPGSIAPVFGAGNSGNFPGEQMMSLQSSLQSPGSFLVYPQSGLGTDPNITNQGALQLPQSTLRPFASNSFGSVSLFPGQVGPQSSPQHPVGGSIFGSDSLISSQARHHHFPQNTFGRVGSSIFETGSAFSAGAQHMPAQSSFGGNPFG